MKSVIIVAIAVLIASISITSIYAQSQSDIPAWVKNNAVWWGEGQISDSEFIGALQYLINNGNLKVASSSEDVTELEEKLQSMSELKDKYQQGMIDLKIENDKLKRGTKSQNTQESSQSSSSNLSVQELKNQAISWNYKDIIRDEEKYIGKIIFLEGKISRIDEREDVEDKVLLYLNTKDFGEYSWDDGEDLMYIWYSGSRLLDDDVIEGYITINSIHIRESAFDGTNLYYPIGTARHVTCTTC